MLIPDNRERQLVVNKAIISSMVIATRTQTLLFQDIHIQPVHTQTSLHTYNKRDVNGEYIN